MLWDLQSAQIYTNEHWFVDFTSAHVLDCCWTGILWLRGIWNGNTLFCVFNVTAYEVWVHLEIEKNVKGVTLWVINRILHEDVYFGLCIPWELQLLASSLCPVLVNATKQLKDGKVVLESADCHISNWSRWLPSGLGAGECYPAKEVFYCASCTFTFSPHQ